MNQISHKLLQFDRFVLDMKRGCLRMGEQEIDLRPKAFELLTYLVVHAGRLVPKEELLEAVWPNVVVSDETLVQSIRQLRQKLGDEAHRLIKTVPRRGYLLDVVVQAGHVTAVSKRRVTKAAALVAIESPAEKAPIHEGKEITPAQRGERKQVTILCADFKESLELISQRDPEEALSAFEAVIKLMTQAVHRYDGTVHLVTSDGMVALFGAPLAHEDHAVRACYAALQIQDALNQYGQGLPPAALPIQARVGLDSGEVVIAPIARGSLTEYRVISQSVILATRIRQTAAPGSSLISVETLRLAHGHIEVTAPEFANISRPGELVYRLVDTSSAQTRFQAVAKRGLTRFVGRRAEIEQIERALTTARQGHGQVVAIIGEAGIGKSRLVYEFIHSAHTESWLALEAAAFSHRTAPSYQPVIELLKAYFKIRDCDHIQEKRGKVLARLLALDRVLAPDAPALLALLDIPVDDLSWHALDARECRQRTLDALKRLILRECQNQPVILVFEDLHWIDSETQAFLDNVIDGVASAPLLLILTYRPDYEHRWGGKSYYTQVRLNAMSPETTEQFLGNLMGDDPSLVRLKEALPKHANPFFLEETIRFLVETNVLTGNRGAYHLFGDLPELDIPPNVQAILAARIDRLPPADKRLLQAASVVGKHISYAILQAIAGLGEDELRRGLAKLQEAEFLYETQFFPEIEYGFRHALTHDVAYRSLLVEQRRVLHRQVVDVIERVYCGRLTEHIDQLAHHALYGQLGEKAIVYLRQAGKKAAARSALKHAQACLEQALNTVKTLEESRSKLEQAFEIHLDLRQVLGAALQNPVLSLDHLSEAQNLAERLDDDHRRARVAAFMTNLYSLREQCGEALVAGARALEIAERLGDLELCILARTYLGHAYYVQSDYKTVIERVTHTLSTLPSDSLDNYFGMAASPSVFNRAWLIISLAQVGRFAEAGECAAEAIRLSEETQHAHTMGLAYLAGSTLQLLKGDWMEALSLIESAKAVTTSLVVLSTAVASSAWTLAQLGKASEALDQFHKGKELLERRLARGMVAHRGWDYQVLGRACLLLGQMNEARVLGECALKSSASQHGYRAHAHHLLGDIASHHKQFDSQTAKAHYCDALVLARRCGMRPLVAHCQRGLGKLYLQVGERPKAKKHVAMAIGMYREMGMRYWLKDGPAEIKV